MNVALQLATSHDRGSGVAPPERTFSLYRSLGESEQNVARMLAHGCSSKTIAARTGLKPQTVRKTISGLLSAFGVETSLRFVACHGHTIQQL